MSIKNWMFKNLIYFILALAFLLRIINLNQSLWLDEAAQAIESRQSLGMMLESLKADFHPPLYHLLLHYWISLGTEEWQMRLLSVLFGVMSVFLTYLLTKKLFSQKVGLIAAFLLAINPFHIYFSQELRPYILTVLTSLWCIYLFWRAVKLGGTWWWLLSLATLVNFYTTYFAVFLSFSQVIFLLITGQSVKVKQFALGLFFPVILFIPWLPYLLTQLQISSGISHDLPNWIDAVSSPVYKALPLTIVKFIVGQISFTPAVLYLAIASFIAGLWAYLIIRSVQPKQIAWKYVFWTSATLLVIPVVFSYVLQVVAPKRLIFVLPLVLILLSVGLNNLNKRWFGIFLTSLILINSISLGYYYFDKNFQREDWRGAVAKIGSVGDEKSVVLFKFSSPFAPYIWYSKKSLATVGLSKTLLLKEPDVKKLFETEVAGKQKILVFEYLGGLTDPDNITDLVLKENNYKKTDTYNFNGVGLIDYYK